MSLLDAGPPYILPVFKMVGRRIFILLFIYLIVDFSLCPMMVCTELLWLVFGYFLVIFRVT